MSGGFSTVNQNKVRYTTVVSTAISQSRVESLSYPSSCLRVVEVEAEVEAGVGGVVVAEVVEVAGQRGEVVVA